MRGFDATRTAQTIELSQGGMDSLLVTAAPIPAIAEQLPAPRRRCGSTHCARRKRRRKKSPRASVVSLRRSEATAALRPRPGGVGCCVAAILNGPFLAAGLGRLFTPWLAISYPTKTKIELGEGELVIKEGAAAAIEIRLSGAVPKTAKLDLQTGEGSPREIELECRQRPLHL